MVSHDQKKGACFKSSICLFFQSKHLVVFFSSSSRFLDFNFLLLVEQTNLEGSTDRKFLKGTEKVDGTFSSKEQSNCK